MIVSSLYVVEEGEWNSALLDVQWLLDIRTVTERSLLAVPLTVPPGAAQSWRKDTSRLNKASSDCFLAGGSLYAKHTNVRVTPILLRAKRYLKITKRPPSPRFL